MQTDARYIEARRWFGALMCRARRRRELACLVSVTACAFVVAMPIAYIDHLPPLYPRLLILIVGVLAACSVVDEWAVIAEDHPLYTKAELRWPRDRKINLHSSMIDEDWTLPPWYFAEETEEELRARGLGNARIRAAWCIYRWWFHARRLRALRRSLTEKEHRRLRPLLDAHLIPDLSAIVCDFHGY